MDLRDELPKVSTRGIALIYLMFGGAWILVSDRVVEAITNANPTTTIFQSIKGGAFVLLSGALIHSLMRYRERQLETSQSRMKVKSQESQVLQRILRHNIRNDLNVITGYIDMAQQDVTDGETTEELLRARKTADELLKISEKVQNIEGLQVSESVPEPVDVVSMIRREVDQKRSEYPGTSITTDLPDECMVNSGPSLRYAINELLTNSIEHYASPLEELRVTVSVEEFEDTVRIELTDNGSGIPDRELEAINRGEETQLHHGTGVGLWLVNWVCDLYGGSVSFDSKPGGGATVTIDLRRA